MKQHWLYRSFRADTASICFENIANQNSISLRLSHPIYWNDLSDIHNNYVALTPSSKMHDPERKGLYAGFRENGKSGHTAPKPKTRGVTDFFEGINGSLTSLEYPKEDPLLRHIVDSFIDPKIRAICFSYFYGTEQGVKQEALESGKFFIDKNDSSGKVNYLYSTVENIFNSLLKAQSFPPETYLAIAPVRYGKSELLTETQNITTYQYPWGKNFESHKFFNNLNSIYCTSKLLLPNRGKALKHLAEARNIRKLNEPYFVEKEVRLVAYSPDFLDTGDRSHIEDFHHIININARGITTSLNA